MCTLLNNKVPRWCLGVVVVAAVVVCDLEVVVVARVAVLGVHQHVPDGRQDPLKTAGLWWWGLLGVGGIGLLFLGLGSWSGGSVAWCRLAADRRQGLLPL